MSYNYQYVIDPVTNQISTLSIKRISSDSSDIWFIPNNEDNIDWKAYQAWLAEGNTPRSPEAV